VPVFFFFFFFTKENKIYVIQQEPITKTASTSLSGLDLLNMKH